MHNYLVALSLSLGCCMAQGQSLPPDLQLPHWVATHVQALAKQNFEISTRLNPFVWRGDFDGNHRDDLAVLIRDVKSKKEGVAFIFKNGSRPVVVGAGKKFGNGGDDFSWLDLWYVEDRGSLQRNRYDKPTRLAADGLIVAKESSASALIYIVKGEPKWQQQGD